MNDSALKYFKKVLDYSLQTHSSRVIVTAYTNLADVYVRSGYYDQGAWYYRQTLYIADSMELPQQELINTYTGLGQTYMELRDFELSHYYYDLAYRLFDLMDLNRKFVYFTNHGNVYYFEERYPEALELFKKGYELVKPTPEYAYAQNICMVNIGEIYLLMGQLDSAKFYLDPCLSYFEAIQNSSAVYHARTQLFELALKKGNIREATKLLHAMTDNLYAEPTLVGIRKKYLQHYYEETGDYRKAYQYLKENLRMDDSIRNDRHPDACGGNRTPLQTRHDLDEAETFHPEATERHAVVGVERLYMDTGLHVAAHRRHLHLFLPEETTGLPACRNAQQDHQPEDGKHPQPRIASFYLQHAQPCDQPL